VGPGHLATGSGDTVSHQLTDLIVTLESLPDGISVEAFFSESMPLPERAASERTLACSPGLLGGFD
jgi:hypothetical protein